MIGLYKNSLINFTKIKALILSKILICIFVFPVRSDNNTEIFIQL